MYFSAADYADFTRVFSKKMAFRLFRVAFQPVLGCVLACFALRLSLFHVAFKPVSECVSASNGSLTLKSAVFDSSFFR